jgi:phosphotransferase system enzyme I (PtsI)
MKSLKGFPVSTGYAQGKVFCLDKADISYQEKSQLSRVEEKTRFDEVFKTSHFQLDDLYHNMLQSVGEEKADIFKAHQQMLEDPEIIGPCHEMILNEKASSEFAIATVFDQFIQMFEKMSNAYLKERASDLKDLKNRLLQNLSQTIMSGNEMIGAIIVADDITPSFVAQFSKFDLQGLITKVGGGTSHTAILAKSLGLPCIQGIENLAEFKNGQMCLMDAHTGEILLEPTSEAIATHQKKIEAQKIKEEKLKAVLDVPSASLAGEAYTLKANIASDHDVAKLKKFKITSVGLFRTEFIYMGNHAPTLNEQYKIYKNILSEPTLQSVTIRTLDIGGDKKISYLNMPHEANPFLGVRSIRFSLKEKNLFMTQIEALIKVGLEHPKKLQVMFPMVTTISEWEMAMAMVEIIAKEKFSLEMKELRTQIQFGVMIEVPAAAICAAEFAPLVDFFSIGSNDLTQYTCAVDRINDELRYLYQEDHPAVLALIGIVIEAGKKFKKSVCLCGDMASHSDKAAALFRMGLREFSVEANNSLEVKSILNSL